MRGAYMGCGRLICEGGHFSAVFELLLQTRGWLQEEVLSSGSFPCVWLERGGSHRGCSLFSDFSSFVFSWAAVCVTSGVSSWFLTFLNGVEATIPLQRQCIIFWSHSQRPNLKPTSPGPFNDAIKCLWLNSFVYKASREVSVSFINICPTWPDRKSVV